jgi:hypothetical protein
VLIRAAGLDQTAVQQAVAAQLIGMPAIASAVSSAALGLACPHHTVFTHTILRNYHGKPREAAELFFASHPFICGSSRASK